MKTTWEQLIAEEEARLKGLLCYRSPQLPQFQIPSELPSLIPTESRTPAWVEKLTEQDAQAVKKAEQQQQSEAKRLAGVVGEPTQFRQKRKRFFGGAKP
jgi:hypothetical protein